MKCYAIFENQIDMPKDEWKITSEEAKSIASEYGLPYFETSWKTREGIDERNSYVMNEMYEKFDFKKYNNINNLKNKKMNKDSNSAGQKKIRIRRKYKSIYFLILYFDKKLKNF